MIQPIQTYTDGFLARHRETHARHAVFGTHRHPYLLPIMESLATSFATANGEPPSLLDYGCGKAVFMREMAQTGRFRFIRGYDPAVDAFKARPAQPYDVVICLDVLDQLEDAFVESVIQDVAQLTAGIALFDVITVQTPALAHLNPRSAETWRAIVGRHMRVKELIVRPASPEEIAQGACPERTIVLAGPLGGADIEL